MKKLSSTPDNQKKYEEAAKARYPLNNGAEYDPECAKWQDHAVIAFLAGASFAEKEAHNAAIDKALTAMKIEWREDRHEIYNAIAKLKI